MAFNEDIADKLINAYYRSKALDTGMDYVTNHGDNKLRHQDLELSILERKRALGLPISSDDYQEAANTRGGITDQLFPVALNRGLAAIPGAIEPKHQPFFKVAHSIEDLLPSIGKTTQYGAKANGSISRFLSRAASL